MAEYRQLGGLVHLMNQSNPQVVPGNGYTILLVDDNAIQAATRQAILRRAGYFVIAALNPVRALEQFKEQTFSSPVSAIMTDHIMPGMTGSEFVRELRRTGSKVPVIVISGLEEAEDEYSGMDVRFLLKPVPPEILLANMRDLLEPAQEGAA